MINTFRFIKKLLTGSIVFLACSHITLADDTIPHTLDELKTALEKVRIETKAPALGVALVNKNGTIWQAGLGEADFSTHKPVDENSIFRIGSSSKMFVALAALKLVEEGKLNLNDKLSDLVPEIYFENPWEATNPIRVVHLLEHTTGWDDIGYPVYSRQDPTIALEDAIAFHPSYRKSRWIPGTRYAYCNGGPAITAYIIQKITGKNFEDYVKTEFLTPLQMSSTGFTEDAAFKARGVTLYSADAKPQPYWHIIMRPAGGMNASTKDMANLLSFFIGRGNYNQQQILLADSITRMETPTTTLGAQQGAGAGYGLHNYIDGDDTAHIAFRGHDGAVSGGHCKFRYIPELGLGYVLLINQDNLDAIIRSTKLIRGFLLNGYKKEGPQEIALPEKFKKLNGYYQAINPRSEKTRIMSEVFGVMHFSVENNHLVRSPLFGDWKSSDYAINENTLYNPWAGLPSITLVNDPLAGEAVEVTESIMDSLYVKVSAVRVFGTLGTMGLAIFFSLTSIVIGIYWGIQQIRKQNTNRSQMKLTLWPMATGGLLLLALFTPNILQPSIEDLGRISPVTLSTFIYSLLFPLLAVLSTVNCIKEYSHTSQRKLFWHASLASAFYLGFAGLLGYYGYIGMRMWV